MPRPLDNLVQFDGVKATSLSGISDAHWWDRTRTSGDEQPIAPLDAFDQVPWLFRAIDLRAKAVQTMPFALYQGKGKTDVSESERYAPLVDLLRNLLWLSEASLCIHAKSFWALETNQFGGNLTPRWIEPCSVTPEYENGEPVRFKRTIGSQEKTLKGDEVLYCWLPSLRADVGPGTAPAVVAAYAAGVLRNTDRYLANYFERGAIRATLLQIEGNPPTAEKEKLERWWKRLLTGVKKAFETVAISAAVKPIVIGDSLKDTVNKDLTQQEREDVATAIGVPFTLLNAIAANHATANQDWINFYDQTVIPQARLLEVAINKQYLSRLGLRLKFLPKKLECFQAAELQKAEAIAKLVGKPVLTRDEGREMLGYDPWPESEEPAPVPQTVPTAQPATGEQPQEPQPDTKTIDLGKWERKALKRLSKQQSPACTFDSDAIPVAEHAAILEALGQATTPEAVKAAFKAAARIERADVAGMLDDDLIAAAAQLVAEARDE